MSFEELEREIQQDMMAERWQRLRPAVIALLILVVSTVAGYQLWQYYQKQQENGAANRYFAAQSALLEDNAKGIDALSAIIDDTNNLGYQTLAQFRLAAEYTHDGKVEEAHAILFSLSRQSDLSEYMNTVATLQMAMLPLDSEQSATVLVSLSELSVPESPWRHVARYAEIGILLRQGNQALAQEKMDTMLSDTTTPQSLRETIQRIASVL